MDGATHADTGVGGAFISLYETEGAVCPSVLFVIYFCAHQGGEDDAKSVFDRVNHVPPNRDAAGEKLRQIEEA